MLYAEPVYGIDDSERRENMHMQTDKKCLKILAENRREKIVNDIRDLKQLAHDFPLLFSPERISSIGTKKLSVICPSVKNLMELTVENFDATTIENSPPRSANILQNPRTIESKNPFSGGKKSRVHEKCKIQARSGQEYEIPSSHPDNPTATTSSPAQRPFSSNPVTATSPRDSSSLMTNVRTRKKPVVHTNAISERNRYTNEISTPPRPYSFSDNPHPRPLYESLKSDATRSANSPSPSSRPSWTPFRSPPATSSPQTPPSGCRERVRLKAPTPKQRRLTPGTSSSTTNCSGGCLLEAAHLVTGSERTTVSESAHIESCETVVAIAPRRGPGLFPAELHDDDDVVGGGCDVELSGQLTDCGPAPSRSPCEFHSDVSGEGGGFLLADPVRLSHSAGEGALVSGGSSCDGQEGFRPSFECGNGGGCSRSHRSCSMETEAEFSVEVVEKSLFRGSLTASLTAANRECLGEERMQSMLWQQGNSRCYFVRLQVQTSDPESRSPKQRRLLDRVLVRRHSDFDRLRRDLLAGGANFADFPHPPANTLVLLNCLWREQRQQQCRQRLQAWLERVVRHIRIHRDCFVCWTLLRFFSDEENSLLS